MFLKSIKCIGGEILHDKIGSDYKVADLSQEEIKYLVDKEAKLRSETNKQYVLVAFEKK